MILIVKQILTVIITVYVARTLRRNCLLMVENERDKDILRIDHEVT